jgi:hypothetical protein
MEKLKLETQEEKKKDCRNGLKLKFKDLSAMHSA